MENGCNVATNPQLQLPHFLTECAQNTHAVLSSGHGNMQSGKRHARGTPLRHTHARQAQSDRVDTHPRYVVAVPRSGQLVLRDKAAGSAAPEKNSY